MKNRKQYTLSQRERVNEKFKHVSLEMETSTHFPMLIKVVQNTDEPIIELGSGLFSTPLLHWLCFDTKRDLTTCESYPHYLEFANKFKTDFHNIHFVKDWSEEKFNKHYSVVLIDHSVNGRVHTRGDDALRFKDIADYIVLHDAGEEAHEKYGYAEIYPQFKYRHDWTGCYPNTTVLSNTKDLSWLKT